MDLKSISEKIKTERQLKAISGVSYEQFVALLPIFDKNIRDAIEESYKNKDRKQGSGKKGDIKTSSEKLLLILHYLKCYSTFYHLGLSFGISGSSASQYVYNLMKTLNHFGVLPHSSFKTPEEMKAAFQGFDTLLVDATERSIQRPQAIEIQKESYSDKKTVYPQTYHYCYINPIYFIYWRCF